MQASGREQRRIAQWHVAEAVGAAYRRQELARAIQLIRDHLEQYPDDPDMTANLGTLLRLNGELEEAQRLHARLAAAAPGSRSLQVMAADSTAALAIHQGDWPRLERLWNDIFPRARGGIRAGEDRALPSALVCVSVDANSIRHTFGRRFVACLSNRPDTIAMRLSRYMIFWRIMRALVGRPFTVLFDPTDGDAEMPSICRLASSGRCDEALLVPDADYVARRGYREELADMGNVPWPERRDAALWRGAPTGNVPPGGSCNDLWRVRLCRIAAGSDGRIDAGLHRLADLDRFEGRLHPEADVRGNLEPWMKDEVPSRDYGRWRWQIDIDGHTNAWGGMFQRLASRSPVLKVASREGWRQWYYDQLGPWENMVPVAPDLADLLDKVDWLRAHEEEARAIGARGRRLAEMLDFDTSMKRTVATVVAADEALRAGRPPRNP